jgi:hypothetical protein
VVVSKSILDGSVAKSVTWVFENNPPMGGAAGEAFTNTLASSGMPPAAVLARESIQNSVDARAGGDAKVAVDFVAKQLSGNEKAAFAKAAGLIGLRERVSVLGLKDPNCLALLTDAKAPLKLLYINDYNTTGLEGDPTDADSKFYRFLLSLGDGGKEHEEHGTGGSYGFGKSVYSSNSGILTIFAYSRTFDGSGEPLSLLFGCGYFRKHKHDGSHFTGRSWFGRDRSTSATSQLVEPLRGGAADEAAIALGFDIRDAEKIGTSVLIVDAKVEPGDILRGVEDWWWPRILSNQLDVRVVDADGKVALPRPKKRSDLLPFVEAFYLATGVSPPNNKTDFRRVLNKLEATGMGSCGFKVLEKNEADEYVVGEERVDAVALVRVPLMVVAYYRQWNVQTPALAGTFIGDGDIDDILRAAEPPAHDRWDVDARRLQDSTGRKRVIVDRVLKGIKRALKQTQSTASPPPPPRPKRLTMLERTLASFLTPSKAGAQVGGGGGAAPISLTYDFEPRAEAFGDKLRLTAAFSVRIKPDEELEEMRARIRVTCPVIEDGQIGDSIPLEISTSTVLDEDTSRSGWSQFNLGSKAVKFECRSEPYDPLWTVRFVPEVEPVVEAE